MPLKCESCHEESVVEEDVGDGREQLICVECGTVATSQASQPKEQADCLPSTSFSVLQGSQKEDYDGEAEVCMSCGDFLQPGDLQFCGECKEMEEGSEEPSDSGQNNKKIGNTTEAHKNVCPSCGSPDLIADSMALEQQTVCKSCGYVLSSQNFTTNDSENNSTSTFGNRVLTMPRFAQHTYLCSGYKVGVEKISIVHQMLALSNNIKEDAVEMYGKLFYLSSVVNKTIRTKEHIAIACVYLACRRENLPVSMIHFQDYRDSYKLFIKAIKIVTTLLKIKILPPSLGTQIQQSFNSIRFEIGRADCARMLTQVRDIMFLCRDAWLTSGRHTQPMILVAIYYVYLNSDVCPKRITLIKFCSKFKLPPISKAIVYDFQRLFLRLAAHLPWAKREQVKPSTIHLYIDDILKYKKSLIHLAFITPDAGKECKPWEEKLDGQNLTCESDSLASHSLASTKKEVLMPASFKRAREAEPVERPPEPLIPPHLDLDCPEIKPTDFSEEEISSYLFTSVELEHIKEVKENVFSEKRQKMN